MKVALTVTTGPFVKGMKRAASRVAMFRKRMGAGIKRIAKYGGALAALALGALVLIVRKQLKAIDAVAKLSAAIGIQVAQLQAMQLAASIAGIETDKLNKALNRMIKSVNDGTLGLTTAVRAFDALGLNVNDLAGMKPDEIFKAIADAVQKAGNGVKTLGAIMDIFGARNGLALINLLKQGSEGINQFEREVDELGLAMSRIDVSKVEAANDSMTRAKALLTAMAQKLTVELAPFITATVDKFIELGKEGTNAGESITNAMEKVAKSVGFVARLVQSFGVAIQALRVVVSQLLAFTTENVERGATVIGWITGIFTDAADEWVQAIAEFADAARMVADEELTELGKRFDELGADTWAEDIGRSFDEIRADALAAAEDVEAAGDAFNALGDEAAAAASEIQKLANEAQRIIERNLTPLERLIKDKDRLNEIFDSGKLTLEQYNRELKRLTELFNKATESADKLSEAVAVDAKATGDFSQVDSISRLALKGNATTGINQRADEALRKIMEERGIPIMLNIETMLQRGLPIAWQ